MQSAGCWQDHELLLAAGSLVVSELRAAVRSQLGYSCSAGVAHNKLLAKLGCGLHKPNQQTLVPLEATAALLAPLDLSRLRGLGAKLGERVKGELGCDTVGELAAVPVSRLIDRFGAAVATQLGMLARGEDRQRESRTYSQGDKYRHMPRRGTCSQGETAR